MNNEFITLIAGFIISIVVSVFASIIMNLLLKRKHTIRNSGKPVVVYGQKAIEQIAKYCAADTINTKDLLDHPSTLKIDDAVKMVESKNEKQFQKDNKIEEDVCDSTFVSSQDQTIYVEKPNRFVFDSR